jgi:hypothetical protein
MNVLMWLIPFAIFLGTFAVAWALVPFPMIQELEKLKKRKMVEEIDNPKEFAGDVLSLYYKRMKKHQTHPRKDLLRWFDDEQKRDKGDKKWREFFLAGKKDGQVQQILFATYSHGFVNVYGFTYDKAKEKKEDSDLDKVFLEAELLNKMADMVARLPQCYGILAELDKTRSGEKVPLEELINKKLDHWKIECQRITLSFRLPDLSHNCDPAKERDVALLFVKSPFHTNEPFSPSNPNDVRMAIGSLYDIYADSYPKEDRKWQTYIADLKARVLAKHPPATPSS